MDRSFEEVRLDFLEASKTGNAQQHVNELIAQYNDAMAKLNQLKTASPDTIQMIANIYNQSVQEQKTQTVSSPSSNIFAVANATVASPQTQNPFQLSNVFGGSQTQTPALNAGSIFGGAPANNPFQVAAQNSIFGGPKDQQPPASNFTFSLSSQQSVFGSKPESSIFGESQQIHQQQQQPSAGSIFGGQASNTFGASSVFAAPQQQLPQQASSIFGSSVFAPSQPAPPGIFSSSQQIAPQSSTFSQATNNVFGGFQAQPDPAIQNTGSMFTQPPQNVFSMQQTQAPAQQISISTATGTVFQIQQPTAIAKQAFGANPFQTQPPAVDESAYSRPEDLTPDEMQVFQAETFQLGNIPFKPPPKHLCT